MVSIWIDFSAANCSELSLSLWNAVGKALSFLERETKSLAEISDAGSETVPIASPEEATRDDTIAENWLECIFEQWSKGIEFLLRLLSNARTMTQCNESIANVFEKVENLSNTKIVGYLQNTYISLCRRKLIGADLQTELLQGVLTKQGQQKSVLLRTIINGSTGDALSQLVAYDKDCTWSLDLETLGKTSYEWLGVIKSLAEFSLRHPSQSFLSGTYSLLISDHFGGFGENLDLVVLLFIMRHLPRLNSEQGQRDIQVIAKSFNKQFPGVETSLKQFVHPENVSKLAVRAVKLFINLLHEGKWQPYVQSFILTVLIIESTSNRLGADLFEAFTTLLYNIDIHEVDPLLVKTSMHQRSFSHSSKEACIALQSVGGIDRLHCVLSIFRNKAFFDLHPGFAEQCRQAVTEDVLSRLIADNNAPQKSMEWQHFYSMKSKSNGKTGPSYPVMLKNPFTIHYIFRSDKESVNLKQIQWMLETENTAQVRFCYLSETLLLGATSAQPIQIFERKPVLDIFCSFYEAVLSNENIRPSWIELHNSSGFHESTYFDAQGHCAILADTLDRCASREFLPQHICLTPAFVNVDAEVMHCAMRDCVGAILRPSLIDELHEFYAITVQSTDRSAQTALNWEGKQRVFLSESERQTHLHGSGPLGRCQDVFHEILTVICNYADVETHVEVLRHCAENLTSWIVVSTEEENVLRGQSLLMNENRLVFRLIVVSNLLEYCSQLGKHTEPYQDDVYFSDCEALKNVVTRRGGPTALPTVERRVEESRSVNSIPLCTYAATEKEFVHQHWYNCHTCKMTDNKGVCSVCAVNCHRGHDLSYREAFLLNMLQIIRFSKQGSFFCDCGANGCSALTATIYQNSAISAARGRTLPAVHTGLVRNCIESRVEVIERIIRASLHACDSRWSLDQRRDNVRQSLADHQRLRVVYDQAVMFMRLHLFPMLYSENGCHLWFILAEHATTLQIFHVHPGQSLLDELEHMRIDSEPVGFAGRQIACRGDKVAVAGLSDILTLRLNREGEIVDRMVIKLGEITTTHNNSIMKVLWAQSRPALLAVATIQLVRIYDLLLDADNFVEELVLPVGTL
ncbi:unnamed protein product [Angiostrongylus costaricensis]|uniref:UBR-type domain-containing protein n=1 Tax=Angiostrongylus costaricensis TaxID=334426 RepID=A0A0R3PJ44_ANGCS|nr:unnamed protein product [Angiostrongylus costaricensis]